jgi:hypothetical protein
VRLTNGEANSVGLLRMSVAAGAAVASVIVAVGLSARAGVPYMNDFIAYWTAGRLLLDGGNPYDVAAILELQRQMGSRFVDPGVVRNPPWVLPLLIPFAALPFAVGWYAWAAAQLVSVGLSAAILWRLFGGEARPAAAVALTFLFPPAVFVALGGQIGGILLLGLAGFTWAVERRKCLVSGLFLALLTLKPHLLLPFGIVVLLWMIRERRFAPLIGAAAGVILGCSVALLIQPELLEQYAEFIRAEVPEEDLVSTPGAALRLALGFDRFWIQWLPAMIGVAWGIVHYLRHKEQWSWSEQLPLLAAVSWLSAPYGWVYDMVLLVPTILDGAARLERHGDSRLRRRGFTLFLVFGIMVWAQQLRFGSGVVHAWVGFAVLFFWLGVRARTEAAATRSSNGHSGTGA